MATYHTRVHTEQQLIVLGSDACLKKYHVKRRTSLRGQTRVSERRLGYLTERSALGAAPDMAVVDVGFSESKNLIAESHEQQ